MACIKLCKQNAGLPVPIRFLYTMLYAYVELQYIPVLYTANYTFALSQYWIVSIIAYVYSCINRGKCQLTPLNTFLAYLLYYICMYSCTYLYNYVTGFAKTVPNGTRIEIPFIAWHES